ncbi:hypothetical protein ACLOJK_006212 [Asimina triloba]
MVGIAMCNRACCCGWIMEMPTAVGVRSSVMGDAAVGGRRLEGARSDRRRLDGSWGVMAMGDGLSCWLKRRWNGWMGVVAGWDGDGLGDGVMACLAGRWWTLIMGVRGLERKTGCWRRLEWVWAEGRCRRRASPDGRALAGASGRDAC